MKNLVGTVILKPFPGRYALIRGSERQPVPGFGPETQPAPVDQGLRDTRTIRSQRPVLPARRRHPANPDAPEHRPLLRSVRRPGSQLPGGKVYRRSGVGPNPPAAQRAAGPDTGSPDLSEDPGYHAGIRPRFWPGALHGQPVQHSDRAGWHDHSDQFWLLAPCRPLDVFLRASWDCRLTTPPNSCAAPTSRLLPMSMPWVCSSSS